MFYNTGLKGGTHFLAIVSQSPEGVLWAGADKQSLDAIFKEVGRQV